MQTQPFLNSIFLLHNWWWWRWNKSTHCSVYLHRCALWSEKYGTLI